MFLLPVGHDESIRRVPVATIGIIALNFLLFFVTHFGIERQHAAMLRATRAADQLERRIYSDHVQELRRSGTGEPALSWSEFWRLEEAGELTVDPDDAQALDRLRERARAAEATHPYRRFAFSYAHPTPLAALTHMFMHGGWLHILFNMYFLWLTGANLEYRWGAPVFVVFYLLGGGVALASMAPQLMGVDEPLLGASGAVAACMGAFMVRHHSARVQVFYFYAGMSFARWGVFPISAWVLIGLWALQQVFFASFGLDLGVAFWAHIGGFAFGALFALALGAARWEDRVMAARVDRGAPPPPEEEDLTLAESLVRKESWEDALLFLRKARARWGERAGYVALLARTLARTGPVPEAAEALTRALALLREGKVEREPLLDAVVAYVDLHGGVGIEPRELTAVARMLEEDGRLDEAVRVLDGVWTRAGAAFAPKALVRAAQLLENLGDRDGAADRLTTMLEEHPTSPLAEHADQVLARLREE